MESAECEDELTGTEISCLRLKGQMISLPETENILFLCSPRFTYSLILVVHTEVNDLDSVINRM